MSLFTQPECEADWALRRLATASAFLIPDHA
jgi:hypothetical protein